MQLRLGGSDSETYASLYFPDTFDLLKHMFLLRTYLSDKSPPGFGVLQFSCDLMILYVVLCVLVCSLFQGCVCIKVSSFEHSIIPWYPI